MKNKENKKKKNNTNKKRKRFKAEGQSGEKDGHQSRSAARQEWQPNIAHKDN